MEYKDKLNEFDGDIIDLFDNKSVLSITTGDWKTGLHTGSVTAHMDSIDMLLSHFTVQSEQLPSHFIMVKYIKIKELSELTGVSVRTLRYYDETNLLRPAYTNEYGYRFYDSNYFSKCS